VRFAGPLHDIAPVYRAADAFLLPTAYETFSLVTYEAAASGLPLLVPRVSGVEDLLEHDRNGWFVPREGAGIAGWLNTLADEPELRERFGHAAREASLRFSWGAMVDAYVALYEELGGHPGAASPDANESALGAPPRRGQGHDVPLAL
jgi:glycosyltransferase involved in cell wall biosynthesis